MTDGHVVLIILMFHVLRNPLCVRHFAPYRDFDIFVRHFPLALRPRARRIAVAVRVGRGKR